MFKQAVILGTDARSWHQAANIELLWLNVAGCLRLLCVEHWLSGLGRVSHWSPWEEEEAVWAHLADILPGCFKFKPEMGLKFYRLARVGTPFMRLDSVGLLGFKELCCSVLQNLTHDAKVPSFPNYKIRHFWHCTWKCWLSCSWRKPLYRSRTLINQPLTGVRKGEEYTWIGDWKSLKWNSKRTGSSYVKCTVYCYFCVSMQ